MKFKDGYLVSLLALALNQTSCEPVVEKKVDTKAGVMAPKDLLLDHAIESEDRKARHLCKHYKVELYDDHGRYKPVYKYSKYLGGECKLADFEMGPVIGSGSTCTVKLATHRPSGHRVAIKMGRIKSGTDSSCLRWRNEECIQHPIHHPFIARHYCSMVSPDGSEMYLVEEYVNGNNLHDSAWKTSGAIKINSEAELKRISAMVFLAFEHVHTIGVILRDTKPGNVMLSTDMVVKVVDFGSSKYYDFEKSLLNSGDDGSNEFTNQFHSHFDPYRNQTISAPIYGSPAAENGLVHKHANVILPRLANFFTEIRRHQQHYPYVDFYGFAVILYELLSGRNYKKAWGDSPIHKGDKQYRGFVCFEGMDRDGCDLIERLADLRWTKKTKPHTVHKFVREHPWFASINWDHVG